MHRAAMFNAGIAAADSQWILPLNAGDTLHESACRTLFTSLTHHPELNVLTGKAEDAAERDRQAPRAGIRLDAHNDLPGSIIFRKSLWEDLGGYDASFPWEELTEYLWWLRLLARDVAITRRLPRVLAQKARTCSSDFMAHEAEIHALQVTCLPQAYDVEQLMAAHETLRKPSRETSERIATRLAACPRDWRPLFWQGLTAEGQGQLAEASRCHLHAHALCDETEWQPALRLYLLYTAMKQDARARTFAALCGQRHPHLALLISPPVAEEKNGIRSADKRTATENGENSDIIYCATASLMRKLAGINPGRLPISEYNQRYLSDIQRDAGSMLGNYALILKALLLGKADRLDSLSFLDYGGGSGLLSVLAREVGVGHVYYNDIYDVSCADSELIASALGHAGIVRIGGDLREVRSWCEHKKVLFDRIGSYDVIEHIYDIMAYLESIHTICTPDAEIFFCSGANPYNPDIVSKLIAGHMKVELEDRAEVYGRKKRDSLQSYAGIRRAVIQEAGRDAGTEFQPDTLERLGRATRGLEKSDIVKAVRTYMCTGELPQPDAKFPSNTCDPLTGNWAEHLMDFDKLLTALRRNGFSQSRLFPEPAELAASPIIALFGRRISAFRNSTGEIFSSKL
jgi:2-polyprenyl-3-methyl-5-hydroxy-6-metoxy-1,4-benzoquinol methylase